MTHKKKLVVCLSRFPYPLDKGDKLRAFHQLQQLASIFDVYLICTSDIKISDSNQNELKKFCKEVWIYKLTTWKIAWNLFMTIFSTKPFQVAYFYQFSIHRKIKKVLEEIQPDFIYSQLIRTSEYVKNYHTCSKTLDYMDAFSKGIERRMISKKGITRWIFKQEYQRLVNYERQIFEYFEHHSIISEQDRTFIAHPRHKEIAIIPNGVSSFKDGNYEISKNTDLLFTGNMGYPPNMEAAFFIHQKILPFLSKNTNCLIAGVNPPTALKKLSNKNFLVSGWVEDMGECYSKSKIFIAPMFIGTGLQNKLLEAMAMGIPCITTSLANKALQATPDVEILIANTSEEFVNQITKLQADPQLYTQISQQGKNYVLSNFAWNTCNEKLIELISK
jgi:glycosyltransferase involved in cell wall biosynthesis